MWECTTQAILCSSAWEPPQRLNSLFVNVCVSPPPSSSSTGPRFALAFSPFTEKKYALTLIRFFTSFHYGPSGIPESSAFFGILFDSEALISGVQTEARCRSAGVQISQSTAEESVYYCLILDKKETVFRSHIQKLGSETANRQEGGRLYAPAASPRIIS